MSICPEPERELTVTEAADTLQLLTIAQMRTLAGVTGAAQDAALTARGLAVSANIMNECKIAVGAGADPTLWQETLTETFYYWRRGRPTLLLARRHNVEITSITVDGTALDTTEYRVNPEAGIVTRLSSALPIAWCGTTIIVVYRAGFEELPGDLVQAAADYYRAITLEQSRDPYVKSEIVDVTGVESRTTQLWTGDLPGAGVSSIVPAIVASQLTRFRNFIVG